MRAIRFSAMALTLAATISGCTTRVADLTVASTKNVNLNSGAFTEGRRVEGTDSVPVVIVPLGQPNIKEAIDRAIEKDRCAVGLSNVVINQEFFAFLFGVVQFTAEGNLIIDNGKPGCGGSFQPSYQQRPAPAPYSSGTETNNGLSKEQQLDELGRLGLPRDEYQRRYQKIMGN